MDDIKDIKDSMGIFTRRFPGGDVVVSTIYKKSIKDSYRVTPNTDTQQNSIIDGYMEKIKQLEAENRKLNHKIETLSTEKEQQESSYIEYIENLENQLNPAPSVHRNGKSLEVGSRKVYDIIRLYAMGNNIKSICNETGCSRGQVERILKGTLKHTKSKEKVLKSINKLLQVNQNPLTVEKLTKLKALYT